MPQPLQKRDLSVVDRPNPAGDAQIADQPHHSFKNELLFRTLHEQLGERFVVELQPFIKSSVSCKLMDARTMTHASLLLKAEEPAAVVVAQADTARQRVAWYCSARAVACFLEAMLGGRSSQISPLDRPMTDIEQRLMVRLADVLWEQMATSWSQMAALQFETEVIESAMKRIRIAPATSLVLVVTWQVFDGMPDSTMRLVYPWALVEPFLEGLGRESPRDARHDQPASQDPSSMARLSLVWTATTLTQQELRELQVGDLLVTDTHPAQFARLYLDEICEFEGPIGRHQDQLAMRLDRPLRLC